MMIIHVYGIVKNGHVEVVKYLIEIGGNIHMNDDYTLRYSNRDERIDVINFLIQSD
jgi:hypothetical protein